jgi:hypothetical protein
MDVNDHCLPQITRCGSLRNHNMEDIRISIVRSVLLYYFYTLFIDSFTMFLLISIFCCVFIMFICQKLVFAFYEVCF